MKGLLLSYALGALTFWPLVLAAAYVLARRRAPAPPAAAPPRPAKSRAHGPQQWFKLWDAGEDVPVDRDSDAEAACFVYFATQYVRTGEPGDDDAPAPSSSGDEREKNARSSLQKLVGTSIFHGHGHAPPPERAAKSLAKLPKLWAVVRGGQLQLYEDQKERRLHQFVLLPEFVVTLWPQHLQEFELFYKRHPICLAARSGRDGLVTLDLAPGTPPRDALYLYVDNPTVKEDLYFALIKESKLRLPTIDAAARDLSLGPRDPIEMARPIRVPKAEVQELQSHIWSSSLPGEAKWLNALVARLFFALKNSEWADEYLRRKFTYKLRPISMSSGIIGDIEVRTIHTGSAPPLVHDVKLRELTPDGNLVLSARVKYTGSSRVHLATMVKLSAVTSFTTAEIPIELAATLRHLEGTMVFRIKPAPSDRIWYAFETMPDIDLQMEPVVYETQISLSVVTKYIKNRVVETLRESLVLPFMDDLAFYDTTSSFYRGGIWQRGAAPQPGEAPSAQASAAPTPPPQPPQPQPQPQPASSASSIHPTLSRRRTNGSESSIESSGDLAAATSSGAASSAASLAVPGEKDAAFSQSKVRKFSNWVKRKRSNRSMRQSVPEVSEEPQSSSASIAGSVAGSDTASLMSMSPGSVRQRTASTTQVTPANVTSMHQGADDAGPDAGPDPRPDARPDARSSHSPQRRANQVPRKPVPQEQTEQAIAPQPEQVPPETVPQAAPGPAPQSATQSAPQSAPPQSAPQPALPQPAPQPAPQPSSPSVRTQLGPSALDSPEKWQPTAMVPQPRPSLAESPANASGTPGDSPAMMNQELEENELRLRRSLSQSWATRRPVGSSSSSITPRSDRSSRSSSPGRDASLRSTALPFDQQSISSVGSSGSARRRKQPSLPPRTRKYMPLTNVPPEHDA